VELDFERCYRAVDSRDLRFDGWFVTAVTSTGIYCRPSCPATTPKRGNVRFYPSAAAAQRAGFRACRRCRPDAAPGSPEWDVRADVVGRAMRLIADGVVDREGVPGLAARLGYTTRHLSRMLNAELGAGPLALARAQRAQTARILVETTDLGLAEIAFAAGFGSVRQFNDCIREVYAVAPSALRAGARREPAATPGTITLRLAYRPPLHAPALLEFLAARAIEGVEIGAVEVGGARSYARAMALPHGVASAVLTPRDGFVSATLRLSDVRDLAPAVARCRRLLDLDADPVAVDGTLGEDPALAPAVLKEPGVRVPRTVDGFELAVRAIVGQQISVSGARAVLARLARGATAPAGATAPTDTTGTAASAAGATAGTTAGTATAGTATAGTATAGTATAGTATAGTATARAGLAPRDVSALVAALWPFPDASAVAGAPDGAFGMPAARRATLRAVAAAVAGGDLVLDGGADRADTERALRSIPGIGEWTARYITLRALGDPDVFLPGDLGVRRGAGLLGLAEDARTLDRYAQRWRPWRSYAVMRLWRH
jgi:AraC family transcriptional regulator, regulatory protein of adaptative response / DNA-3-methyladenine glycosylase II